MDKPQAGLREQSASQLSLIIPYYPPHGLGHSLSHPAEPLFIHFPRESVPTLLPVTSDTSPAELPDRLTVGLLDVSLAK